MRAVKSGRVCVFTPEQSDTVVRAGPRLVAGARLLADCLATLERAGLVYSERESRVIRYRADFAGMRRLLAFLMQDCCQGAPEMCGDLMADLACNPSQPQDA